MHTVIFTIALLILSGTISQGKTESKNVMKMSMWTKFAIVFNTYRETFQTFQTLQQ